MREDHETVVSVDHSEDLAWISTTMKGLRNRCLRKGFVLTEELVDKDGRPRRWVFRGVPADLIRIVPRSRTQVTESKNRGKASRVGKSGFGGKRPV